MIFSAFERMVAFRYLRARRSEGFVSVIAAFSFLGIVLGVATLIIVMAVMNGFRQELLSRVLGLNGHIGIYSVQGSVLNDYDELAGKAAKLDGVKMVMPLIEGQVMVSSVRSAQGAIVRGIRPEDFMKRKILSDNMIGGSPQAFFEPDTVLIGDRLAHKLGVYVG